MRLYYFEITLTDLRVLDKVKSESINDQDNQSAHPPSPGWRKVTGAGLTVSRLQREESGEKESVEQDDQPEIGGVVFRAHTLSLFHDNI